MRLELLAFLFLCGLSFGQETPMQFGSEIMVYHMIGHTMNKQPNLVIIDSKGVFIEDRDSCYQILKEGAGEHSVTTAFIDNGDTVFPQKYTYNFIYLPDPKIQWTAMEQFRMRDLPEGAYNTIGLHRDSLSFLKDFEVHHFNPNLPELKWEVVNGIIFISGMKGRPLTLGPGNSLPDTIIDQIKTMGDTVGISMTLSIRGEDGVTGQIGGSIRLIQLDGIAYDKHRDPWYFYHHFADTLPITQKQLFSEDTLTLHNPGRLYIKMPRLKDDYYFKWDNGIGYCYDVPYTKVEAGNGYLIVDEHMIHGDYQLLLKYDQDIHTIDIHSGLWIDPHFAKKTVRITYPE